MFSASPSRSTAPSPTDPTFAYAVWRARAEFLEMPGLKLSLHQAGRLWSMDQGTCAAILAALVEAEFLVQTSDASFIRA